MATRQSTSALAGMAVFLAGLQFAIGSVEMSSRYSVANFSVDQKTLQSAADALSTYIIIAVIWTIATCLVLSADHGAKGIFWGIITNTVFVAWIVISYLLTFSKVAREKNLKFPKVLGIGYSPSPIARKIGS